MITGRDLIIYILQNNLENESIYQDGKLICFMTAIEAAIKFDVGVATVKAWVKEGMLNGIIIGDEIYILENAQHPIKGGTNV